MKGNLLRIGLAAVFGLAIVCVAVADGSKTVSGEVRSVKDKILTVQKIGLFSKGHNTVQIEMDDATKVTGQIAAGMHVKVKYREDGDRKIAVEVETRPEYASKEAKKAAGQTHK